VDEILSKINFLKLKAQHEFASDLQYIERNSRDELKFLSNKKVLFTGGAGFIGYYFYYTITHWNKINNKKKINYTILDNIKKKPHWIDTSKVNFVRRDINKLEKNFFTKFDIIIHGASIASPTFYRKEPIKTMKANILGLWKILESLKNKNKKKILFFFSSSEIYGNPHKQYIPTKESYNGNVSPTGPRACYDESKRFGEALVINYAKYYRLRSVIVRPFNNYGPGMKLNDKRILPDLMKNIITKKNLTLYSDGSPTRTFCYITDAIVGYLKAIKNSKYGNIFNIGSDKPEVSAKQLAKLVAKVSKNLLGYKGKIIYKKNNDKNYLIDNPQHRCPDITKAKAELKFSPKIELENGLYKLLLHYVIQKI
jgi:nucleoside-diphosphate-sugar epimerase